MNHRSKAIAIIGAILLALTMLLFFVAPDHRLVITWVGFIFIILSEIILFVGLILIEYLADDVSPIIIRAGAGTTLIVCTILSILSSIFFIITKSESVKAFVVIQGILGVILAIILVVSYTSAKSVKINSDQVVNSVATIEFLISKLNLLKDDKKNMKFSEVIGKIAEELRYSDLSTLVPSDYELEKNIAQLEIALMKTQEENEQEINNLLEALLTNVNRRKIEVKSTKQGGL